MADQPDSTSPEKPEYLDSDTTYDGAQKAKPHRIRAPKNRKPIQVSPEGKQRQLEALQQTHIERSKNHVKFRNEQVAKWMAMKALEPRITHAEAAKRLGLHPATFKNYIYQATREGFVKFDDSVERLTYEIIPKVMDNLKEFVEKKDRTVTLETAKGTVFKQFQAEQGIQDGGNMVLALKIETSPNDEPRTIAGVIVGQPKVIEE